MKRFVDIKLAQWVNEESRKPLLLRGARQVGKTFAVRNLGKSFANFVEINCEETNCENVFEKNLNPERIIQELSLIAGQSIIPGKTLLFIDEIQQVPRAILALRYFYEKMPSLHIIAAGSLLDFVLEKVGIPVGRVDSIYMYPVSWLEFLLAKEGGFLCSKIFEYSPQNPIPETAHIKLLILLGEYLALGGMPEVVSAWITYKDPHRCFRIQQSLVDTYRQDFAKYANKYEVKYVEILFDQIPRQLGGKFKFSDIPGELRKRELAPCFELLNKAGMVHSIYHTSAQGLPLGADIDLNKFKTIFLDIGLVQAMLNLELKDWFLNPSDAFTNQGNIVEAFVGQEILAYSDPFFKKSLFYCHRETRGSQAEVDYVIQLQNKIIPVEVKSGTTGQVQSLREYLKSHQNTSYSLRFSKHNYSKHEGLISYPLYAIGAALGMSTTIFDVE